ncbi:MAG: C25 family cysteine peptidase, partial [Verrucomicrobiota bacterium]
FLISYAHIRFDATLLREGDNDVEIRGVLGPNIPYSLFRVNSLELFYPRAFAAVDDYLEFDVDNHSVVTVSGFGQSRIHVLDVSRPERPVCLSGGRVVSDGHGYSVSFVPAVTGGRFVAFTEAGAARVSGMRLESPSRLTGLHHRAEHVVITLGAWLGEAEALAVHRRSQGLEAMVVDLEEVYTGFNYGLAGPHAIRSFLEHAWRRWDVPPRYVVLMGDGTYDYKGYLRQGDNLIPPRMAATPFGLFASDMAAGDVEGHDGVPEVVIGRIPVKTSAEVTAAVQKIVAYESDPGVWAGRSILLADNPDLAGNFPADSDALAELIPAGHGLSRIYLSDLPLAEARSRLHTDIHTGARLLNYMGHGGLDRLAYEGLLTTDDLPQLQNGGRLPVLAAMSCIVGRFSVPGYDSFGEEFLLDPDGGGMAVWGATGLSFNSMAQQLNREFVRYLFEAEQTVLGDGVKQAMEAYSSRPYFSFMLDIFTILGDPALKLK